MPELADMAPPQETIPEGWQVLWCPYRECLTSMVYTNELVDAYESLQEVHDTVDLCWRMVTHYHPKKPSNQPERWADIEDPREQFEAMLEMKLLDYQWDYVQHYAKGEKLVRDTSKRHVAYKWVPREDG